MLRQNRWCLTMIFFQYYSDYIVADQCDQSNDFDKKKINGNVQKIRYLQSVTALGFDYFFFFLSWVCHKHHTIFFLF